MQLFWFDNEYSYLSFIKSCVASTNTFLVTVPLNTASTSMEGGKIVVCAWGSCFNIPHIHKEIIFINVGLFYVVCKNCENELRGDTNTVSDQIKSLSKVFLPVLFSTCSSFLLDLFIFC